MARKHKEEFVQISAREQAHLENVGKDYKLAPSKRLKSFWRKCDTDLSLKAYARWADEKAANTDDVPDRLIEAANKWLENKALAG